MALIWKFVYYEIMLRTFLILMYLLLLYIISSNRVICLYIVYKFVYGCFPYLGANPYVWTVKVNVQLLLVKKTSCMITFSNIDITDQNFLVFQFSTHLLNIYLYSSKSLICMVLLNINSASKLKAFFKKIFVNFLFCCSMSSGEIPLFAFYHRTINVR